MSYLAKMPLGRLSESNAFAYYMHRTLGSELTADTDWQAQFEEAKKDPNIPDWAKTHEGRYFEWLCQNLYEAHVAYDHIYDRVTKYKFASKGQTQEEIPLQIHDDLCAMHC